MIVLWRVAAGVLLPLVPTLAVFGNFLVILAVFQDRVLQTVTNMLIVSLAVSDLMVSRILPSNSSAKREGRFQNRGRPGMGSFFFPRGAARVQFQPS